MKKVIGKTPKSPAIIADQISTSGALFLSFIDSFNRLEEHASAWNNLALAAAQQLPMLSYAWISSYLEHRLQPDESWVCVVAHDNARLVGVLPIIITPCKICGLRRSRLSTPFDWHTVSVDMAIEPGRENEVSPLLLSELKHINQEFISLRLNRLPYNSPTVKLAHDGLKGHAFVRHFNGFGSFIGVTGSYEHYEKQLSPRFKRNLRRLERKISSLNNLQYQYINENAGKKEYLDRFLQIELSGWKGKKGSAIL